MTTDQEPVAVRFARHTGTIRDRWRWVEPKVWTERMLTALEKGVKGGVWFSLMDKVFAVRNLTASWERVADNEGAAGVDHVTIDHYRQHLEENLGRLEEALRKGTYRPQAVRRAWIPKAGSKDRRPLGIPTVQDRVVQGAVRHVLEPIFERDFAEHSYGFRPNRGCKDALRRVDELLKAGYRYVVDVDLKSYFDTIPHDRLLELIERKVGDGRVLSLVKAFLSQGILEGLKAWTPIEGAPQGAVLSPLLSNIYLDPLDHWMAQKGYEMIRYADDFVVMCRSPEAAEQALAEVRQWTAEADLTLHPTKTKVVDAVTQGFEFLGYRFIEDRRWPRPSSKGKFRDRIRAKTRRVAGRSLEMIIRDLNATLKGWFGYFKHSYKTTFRRLDSWIRMRLRSILRRRTGKRGRGRGSDHQRWPNTYFASQGLFSMATAHQLACQSCRR
jgi:RNA-directed DNA polymerase